MTGLNDQDIAVTPVFLIGYRCTGKTTTGKLLAQLLNRPFTDTDQALAHRFNTTIAEMVDQEGWDVFRQREKETLLTLCLDSAPVVATGGGIILDPENREYLRAFGTIAWLRADPATLVSRIIADANTQASRPGLTQNTLEDETRQMLDIRDPLYQDLAAITIDTAALSPEAAARHIIRRLTYDRL